MRRRYLKVAAFAVALLLLPKGDVEACGPDWEPDVFVSTSSPDDPSTFAQGQLGILQPGFDSNDYAVAYRYLNGGKLSDAERDAYAPPAVLSNPDGSWWANATPEQKLAVQEAQRAEERARRAAQPPGPWPAERAKYISSAAPTPTGHASLSSLDGRGNIVLDESYVNCPGAAFQTATLTLTDRVGKWGKDGPWLADWIRAQDAVFSNCASKTGATPAPAPADSPALLRQDRAYQSAAASFYAQRFDEAASQFAAITADHDSPWRNWGAYLEARATIRKAFAMGKATDPWSGDLASYDDATMRSAQQMLEALLEQPHPVPSRPAIESELNFIRIRTEPAKRAAEISAVLAGPAPDPHFAQDLQDLNFLLIKHLDMKGPSPLLDWIHAWRGAGTAAEAYAQWQQSHALPWLLMAIVKAGPSDSFTGALINEAQKIPTHTPAYDTVFYHRVRLLIAVNRSDEARTLLDAALPALRRQKASSNLNALLGERMSIARSFTEFLEFAPRPTVSTGSQGATDLQGQCNQRAHIVNTVAPCPEADRPIEFDDDAVRILNQKTSLPLLIEAAKSTRLPQNLRESIAMMAWTRSVLLQDAQSAAALSPLLPKAIRDAASSSVGLAAEMAILHNPGIRPYLEAGVPRVASYSYFDVFRDNWWCKPWGEASSGQSAPKSVPAPAYILPDNVKLADEQFSQLQNLPDSAAVIGQRVIDYAKSHSEDPQVPEALALTVRATHYACESWDNKTRSDTTTAYTQTSKAAFQLLHKRYPNSPWTAKTPYHY